MRRPVTVANTTPTATPQAVKAAGHSVRLASPRNTTSGAVRLAAVGLLALAIGLVLVGLATVEPADAQSGPVAAYGFNAGSGTTAADTSGNGLTGTLSGATWTTAGRFGSALSFNGTNARVNIADHPLLDVTTGMTIEAWVYPTTLSGWRTVILKERPSNLAYALYAHDGARPSGWITAGTEDSVRGTAALPVNTWTHLATTYNGSTLRLYVNGVQVGSKAHTGALFVSGNPLRIGGNAIWGEYFQGRIDEVRIYNRALTATEIQTDMNSPVAPIPDTTAPTVGVTSPTPNATVSAAINLAATASDDVGVAGVQFLIDGVPAGAEDTSAPYSVSIDTTTLVNGPHQVTARARDAAGNTTTSTPPVPITVFNAPPNQAPVAHAGVDFSTFVGQIAPLNGVASSDLNGDSLTYSWNFLSRPTGSAAVLSNPTAASPTFLVDRPGTYVVRLVVNDGSVDSAPDTVSITTENRPPVADAGPDQTTAVTDTVTLNGSGSSDLDGDSLAYAWSFQSRPAGSNATLSNASAVNPTFLVDAFGTYVVRLIVNDGTVSSAADTVIVSTQNSAPVASAGPDQTVFVAQTVNLDGSGSSDVDGHPLTFAWTFASRPPASAAVVINPATVTPSFVVDAAGTYVVQLAVHDGTAGSTPDTVTIVTQNSAPVANAGPDRTAFVADVVTLDGSGSTDVDGDMLTHTWSLTSVPADSTAALNDPTAVAPTFVLDRPGTYVAQLIVRDEVLATATDTVTITTENSPPVAGSGPDQTAVAGQVVLLDGTQSRDPDGDVLAFEWSLTTRPPGSAALLVNSTSAGPSFVVDQPGTYVVQLIVNDGMVNSAPDTTTINTTNSAPAANAGSDQSGVLVGAVVTLDSTQSSDSDGHTLTYSWSLITRPPGSSAAFDDPAAANPTFTADAAGEYVAQLIVHDGFGPSAPDTVLVRTNDPPLASAGSDRSVSTGDIVPLDGSQSTDPNGNPLGYGWQFLSVPSGSSATLQNVTTPNPTFVADLAGAYIVQLTVTDSYGAAAVDSVTIAATAPGSLEVTPTLLAFPDTQVGQQSAAQTVIVSNQTGATITISGVLVTGAFAASGAACGVLPHGQSCAIDVFFSPTTIGALSGMVTITGSAPGGPRVIDLSGLGVTMPTVTLDVSDPNSSETGDTGAFAVTRTGNLESALVVSYTVGGTASASDFVAMDANVTIGAGQASVTVTVTPVGDALIEDDETVVLALAASAAYVIGTPGSATVTIADNNVPEVSVTATNAIVSEAGPEAGTFTVTRTGPPTAALQVLFAVSGTATATADYADLGTTVTIPAGQTSATLTVTPLDDALIEEAETALLALTANTSYTIGASGSATVTFADNDLPEVSVTATDATASEAGADPGTIVFTRTGPTNVALPVPFTVSGTASMSADYAGALGPTVTIPVGQASATLTVTPVDDALIEASETVLVVLSADPAYGTGTSGSAMVTIADNDLPDVTITATDALASESGPDPGALTFSRTGPTGEALQVLFALGGTATVADDYVGIVGPTLTIPAGQASVTLTVAPVDDPLVESGEAVLAALVAQPGYTISAPGFATVTIADNDLPEVTIVATDTVASEVGLDPGTFTFTRTGSTSAALPILFAVSGTATVAVDYTNTIGSSVTIPVGQTSVMLTVTPIVDAQFEGIETVLLTLIPDPAYAIGTPAAATVTVADAQSAPVAAYGFNAGSGTTAADTSGNGLTGTLSGAAWTTAGRFGSALSFDGVNDRVDVADHALLDLTTGMTLEAWVYPTTLTGYRTVILKERPAELVYALYAHDDAPRPAAWITAGTVDTVAGTAALPLNTWTHLATTYNGSILRLYVNGVQVGSKAHTGALFVSGSPLRIGGNAIWGEYFQGRIDEVRIYSRALTATEIQVDMDSPVPPDTRAPAVTVTSPAPNATVSDTISLSAAASDDVGVAGVQFLIDGAPVGAEDTSAPYSVSIDTTTLTNGPGLLTARARDAAGNTATSAPVPITIFNVPPTVTVLATDAAADEAGPDAGTFTIARTGATTKALAVLFGVSGTATPIADYSNTIGTTVTIPVGQASVTRTLTPVLDALIEPNETVILTLAAGSYDIGAESAATVTIAENTPTVTVVATDAAADEAGPDPGTFTFTRTGPTALLLRVNFTRTGTATSGTDFTSVGTFVDIPAGQTSVTRTLNPLLDGLLENNETVTLTLAAGTYAAGAANSATVLITENTPIVRVVQTDGTASEVGLDPGTFTFTRTGPTVVGLRVHFDRSGTATALADYSGVGTFVDVPAGQSSATVNVMPNVDAPNLNAVFEGDETVIVKLSTGPYYVGTPDTATVTIGDSPEIVTVEATDPTATELDEESGTFTFTRTGSIGAPLRVNFALAGTATLGSGADYTFSASGTFIDIPAGQVFVEATVQPNLETLLEGDETVIVTLAAGQYAIGPQHIATVTIADEAATIDAPDPNAAETGLDAATFTVTRHGPTTFERMVDVVFAGTAGLDVDYSVASGAMVGGTGNVRSLRIPAGETSATVTVTPIDDAEIEGAEWVIATVEGTTVDAMIAANDSTTITLALVDTYVVGVGQAKTLQVTREQQTPPGGVVVTVTSDDPGVLAVGDLGNAIILEGRYTGQVTVNGVASGTTTIRASAAGHDESSLGVAVTQNLISTPATAEVHPWEMGAIPIAIGPAPAPAGGLVVDVVSSAPSLIQVATPQVTIPAGAFSANAVVRGIRAGSAYVTVGHPGYVSSTTVVTRTADVVDSVFSFSNGFPAPQIGVQLEASGTPTSASANLTVALSTADTTCLVVPAAVTIPAGHVVATFAPAYGGSAPLPCTTTVTASTGGLGPDTASVTVNPPGISMPGNASVGSGLQILTAARLGNSQHGGVTVIVSSSDPTVVRVSPDAATPGAASIALTIPVGETSVAYYVQGMENTTGSATVTVAPSAAFPTGSHVVTVMPTGIEIQDLSVTRTTLSPNDGAVYVRAGIANANGAGLDGLQMVRAGGPEFVVTLTNSNASVARLVSDEPAAADQIVTKSIRPGSFQTQAIAAGTSFGLAFDPLGVGSTVVTATGPPGVVTTTLGRRTVTVTGPGLQVPGTLTVGGGLQTGASASLAEPAHGGVEVTITSSDPSRVLVSPDASTPGTASMTVAVPDGQTLVPYYVQGVESTTGSATVTVAPAAAFPNGTHRVNVVGAGVEIASLDTPTTILAANDADWWVQVGIPLPGGGSLGAVQSVRAGGPPFVVILTNSNPTVAQLVSDEPAATGHIVMKPIQPGVHLTQAVGGGSSHGLEFDPLAGGTTTVTVTGPPGVATMTTTGVRTLAVTAPAISLPTAFFMGAGLQSGTAAILGGSEHGGIDVTVTSSAPGLVLVSPDAVTPGTGAITVHLDNGVAAVPFFVQGMENVAGTTTLTVSAPGFVSASATVTVAPIAIQIGGLDPSRAAGAVDDTDWWVEVGVPNLDHSALSVIQPLRAGGPAFVVTVTSSSADVAALRSDDPAATGATVTKQIQPGVYYSQAVVTGTTYGLALDPLVVGSTVVTVTGPPGVGSTGLGMRTIAVIP